MYVLNKLLMCMKMNLSKEGTSLKWAVWDRRLSAHLREVLLYIKVRTALHIQPTIIHDELCTVFGDEAPSFRTVARWSQWFREGREEIEDETCT